MTKSPSQPYSKNKSIRVKTGDLFKINLGDGTHAYGHIATKPLCIFYDFKGDENLSPEAIVSRKVLFKLWIYEYVPQDPQWERVGNLTTKELALEPYFFKQDPINRRLYLYHSEFADQNWEKLATLSEVEGLERASVWDAQHIRDRLNSYFSGLACEWVEPIK